MLKFFKTSTTHVKKKSSNLGVAAQTTSSVWVVLQFVDIRVFPSALEILKSLKSF